MRQDTLPDGTAVSTVFLGMDHNFLGRGPPLLWERRSSAVRTMNIRSVTPANKLPSNATSVALDNCQSRKPPMTHTPSPFGRDMQINRLTFLR